MSKKNIVIPPNVVAKRMFNANVFTQDYKNPFLLGYLYYTVGYSTTEIAGMLGCEQRTVRRYMNYYGMKRFHKSFAQLVRAHGIEDALKLQKPSFYPLGVHND